MFLYVYGHRWERERLEWLIGEFMAPPSSTHVLSMGSVQAPWEHNGLLLAFSPSIHPDPILAVFLLLRTGFICQYDIMGHQTFLL